MFCEKKSNIFFIKGVWLSDCVEQEPVIITQPKIIPKDKKTKSVKNPCMNCLGNPADENFFIVSSISRCGDGYIFSRYGNDNFCGTECVEKFIKNNFKMMERISLLANLTFYRNHLI